jgi:hypothetical protein
VQREASQGFLRNGRRPRSFNVANFGRQLSLVGPVRRIDRSLIGLLRFAEGPRPADGLTRSSAKPDARSLFFNRLLTIKKMPSDKVTEASMSTHVSGYR